MDQNRRSSERAQYAGLKRKISDPIFFNMGLMLDALTELEHLSLKLQDRKVKLPEAYRLICHKYVFRSVTQNPGEFYEAQNAANKLDFKGIKLEFGKVHKINQQDFFQKLSDNIRICMFTARASHISSGSDTLLNREKYIQLDNNLESLDTSKWPKKADPCFGDKQFRELVKEFDVYVNSSFHGFRE
jgi:hypothetical protein